MTVIGEVRDALTLVADTIRNTREIVKAVSDGREYLKRYHPEAKQDLALLLEEVTKTLNGLAQVSKVVTNFQFTVAGSALDLQPSRFNDYVIKSKIELQQLESHMGDLKGRCTKVSKHFQALNARSGGSWVGWLDLLGQKREKQRSELSDNLHRVYGVDEEIIRVIQAMMRAVEITLRQVSLALGSSAAANPKNVPQAAKRLEEYASEFEPIERDCLKLAADLRSEVEKLQ